MVTYRQFFDKLSSEQKQTFAAIQQKAIDLSADIAKLIDDTKTYLPMKKANGYTTKTPRTHISLPTPQETFLADT